MPLEEEITGYLKIEGAQIVSFVDITGLSCRENMGYSSAVLFGVVLSPGYLNRVISTPDYVQNMVAHDLTDKDEFYLKEKRTDRLADQLAGFFNEKGYSAYSQSEENVMRAGFYDEVNKATPLPHKTIALMAGLGWIGRHNLLVTPEYGSAVSMCSVLTDAPLEGVIREPIESHCGNCNVCQSICSPKALTGSHWCFKTNRDNLIDVFKCTTCLKCLAFCPFTRAYVRRGRVKGV